MLSTSSSSLLESQMIFSLSRDNEGDNEEENKDFIDYGGDLLSSVASEQIKMHFLLELDVFEKYCFRTRG
jgi:hypothetical protein